MQPGNPSPSPVTSPLEEEEVGCDRRARRVASPLAGEDKGEGLFENTKDYFVGEDIDSSRARTLQVADSVLEKLKTDTLPGIKADKIANLKTLRDAYANCNSTQGDTQSDASKERLAIEAAVKSITDRRIQVQFAADVQWPASDKANAPTRREFQLPADRPFSG